MKKLIWGFFMVCLVIESAAATSFRGIPYFLKITSVDFINGADQNHAKVCYQFSSTVPILDYTDVASKLLNGVPVGRRSPTNPRRGDPQSSGIRYVFTVFNFDVDTYLNSNFSDLALQNLSYINSSVRSFAGVEKPLMMTSSSVNYNDMTNPQYEWVNFCESIPFGKAFSESYVRNFFKGPGPIGYVSGSAQFDFKIVPPPFVSRPLTITFNQSSYAVPVFGTSDLKTGDLRMISFSHFANSLIAIKENVDEKILNDFLREHQDIVTAFSEHYNIAIQLPIDVATLVEIIQRVSGVESPQSL